MKSSITAGLGLLAIALVACAPAFDWREFTPEGSGVVTTFPCRPDRQVRNVTVAGTVTSMHMLVCSASGVTFAMGFLDITDPARVADALSELRAVAVNNLQGANPKAEPVQVSGMTPNSQARRLSMVGRLPDGVTVEAHAAFFAKGLRVYQATVIGVAPAPQITQTFFDGLRFAT